MSDLQNNFVLEFERPVRELENQIEELKQASSGPGIDIDSEIKGLQLKVNRLIQKIYKELTPWERVLLSRHPNRPHTLDYIKAIIDDFHEIHGDRRFADDPAIVCGFGLLDGKRVAIMGIEKGRKTKEKVLRNFGMPRPEGYRKALRLMDLADRFSIPIISFIDTPGAYPGIGAEERGQSQAIAENLLKMFEVKSPIIALVIGEGGSGGALGLGIADRVLMQEYSVYSVISPESCASILWADPKMAEQAANSLKLGPHKAKELKVIDDIVAEPPGGAHRDSEMAFSLVKKYLSEEVIKLSNVDIDELLHRRFKKFREMGNETINTGQE